MGCLRFGDPPHRVREVLGDPDLVEDPDISGLLAWYYQRWTLTVVFWKETPRTEPTGDNTPLHAFESNDEFVTFRGKPLVGMHIAEATALLREAGLEPDGQPVDIESGDWFQSFAGGVTLYYGFDHVWDFCWERVKPPGDDAWIAPLFRDALAANRGGNSRAGGGGSGAR